MSEDAVVDALPRLDRLSLGAALHHVQTSSRVLEVLHGAEALAVAAAADRGPAVRRLGWLVEGSDQLTAVASVHALAQVFDDAADALLSDLLSHESCYLREHAAWVLGSRLPRLDAIGRLVAAVVSGGFAGFLAQRTLERWAPSASDHVALGLEGALAGQSEAGVRARLVETLGLVEGVVAQRVVQERAGDAGEDLLVRCAAVSALGDGHGDTQARDLVRHLADGDGTLGAVASLAWMDLTARHRAPAGEQRGLTVAQLFLHADIDRGLTRAGAGDNGGIATLLVRLGNALVEERGIGTVLTISRGSAADAAGELTQPSAEPHQLVHVPLRQTPSGSSDAWPCAVEVARGIRRIVRRHGPVAAFHLRMADVGSLAAAEVAAQHRIPTVFTLAPDPHAMIQALDGTGALTRRNFGEVDEREHFWFRARLVQRLTETAAHVALFPRPRLEEDLRSLVGVDVDERPSRYTVIPEGVDVAVSQSAAADRGAAPQAFRALETALRALPAERQGLPLALSVGRLHRIKGMASVVEAWAGDPALRQRCNLVIVGGDLVNPTRDEREQLELIASLRPAPGLVLAGHRPHDEVAHWLVAAQHGWADLVAPGGFYVCGSLKEEFGLALLEALAAGLVVVGPDGGGPATYVEDGTTGYLVDTASLDALRTGMTRALDLASQPEPARATRVAGAAAMIESRFTVQGMAAALSAVYQGVVIER